MDGTKNCHFPQSAKFRAVANFLGSLADVKLLWQRGSTLKDVLPACWRDDRLVFTHPLEVSLY